MTIEHIVGFVFGFGIGCIAALVYAWETASKHTRGGRK